MAYTCLTSPTHVIPITIESPTLKDAIGGGAFDVRRQWTRPLRSWELVHPGTHEALEELGGFLDNVQGDVPFWFDGADTLEVTTPILIGVADGVKTDYILPHRNVFVASTVIYLNGAATNVWVPIGGDGITMHMIRFTSVVGNFAQIRAKYRRKAKCIVNTDEQRTDERGFRNLTDVKQSPYLKRFIVREVPN